MKIDPEVCNKFIENTATQDEMQCVIDWLNDDPSNLQKLNNMDKIFCASIIHAQAESSSKNRSSNSITMSRIYSYVAGVVAIFVLCFGMTHIMTESRTNQLESQITTLNVPLGHYLNLELADGTTVWLNAGTRIEYPSIFTQDQRRVKISGEAMFDVMHDDDIPFIVETFAYDITVTGTKFNVVADEDNNVFSTSLLQGGVKITDNLYPDKCSILKPNESATLVGGQLNIGRVDDLDEFIWVKGLVSIKGLTFTELMTRFEKSFGVKITIVRSNIPTINYNHGKVRVSDGIESALRLLQINSDFTYTRNSKDNTIVIE